jgi:thiamine transporter
MSGFIEWFDANVKAYYLKNLFALDWRVAVTIALLALTGLLLIRGGKMNWNGRAISYAAMCLAVSFVLSTVRRFRMPAGGSVVLCSILPLVAFSLYMGVWRGAVLCVAYGFLQIAQGAWIVHPAQGALDYIVAYAALALGGLVQSVRIPKEWKLPAALALTGVIRWAVHILSGMIFFASNAPAEQNAFIYSAVYNAYLFPEVVLSIILTLVPGMGRLFAPLEYLRFELAADKKSTL